MKTNSLKILCALLASLMILSALASCGSCVGNVEDETTSNGQETTEGNQETTNSQGSDATTESGQGGDETEETVEGIVDANHGDLIELANGLANGVNPYFTDNKETKLIIENQIMDLVYGMEGSTGEMQVQSLSTKSGVPYIQNTMDIVLNMKNGKTYCASKSINDATLNLFRYGYYFYETRIEGQTFVNDVVKEAEIKYDLSKFTGRNHITKPEYDAETGILSFKHTTGNDPYIVFGAVSFAAEQYEYLEFKMRVEEEKECSIYLSTEDNPNQHYTFTSIPGEDFVTYLIPLRSAFSKYSGTVTNIRFDINGSNMTPVEFKDMSVNTVNYDGAPVGLSMQRTFYTYSNKMHHLLQLSTSETVANVASVDMVTRISSDTVEKIIVKDKNGLKDTLEGVDWASVEFVGFDIKGAGIFGYILPIYDEEVYKNNRHSGVGSINVTLSDGVYTITQSKVPEGNQLVPSAANTSNANDFYMGLRVYTDENHTFDEFIKQATIERNPLTSENITVDGGHDGAKFVAYDPLRGCYVFTVRGSTFQKAYHIQPNRQHFVVFTVEGDEYDREMYFMTHTSGSGALECAALLGEGEMLLPVPIQVGKNFNDGEYTIYQLEDAKWSEIYFPMIIKAGENKKYTAAHLYQNWGIFPLKQISSIEYHVPYYHLSTGVTETNCIVPFSVSGPTLPDHRAMSAPFWSGQPQHTSGGSHYFLYFTNEQGKTVYSTTDSVKIDSYGPTYSDITLGYVSTDGRIDISYTHIEFPQTDENRAFYEMSYEFKEDVSFTDFAKQFNLYRCTDNDDTGIYQKLGYLDKDNKHQIANTSTSIGTTYVLGDNAPYFTLFDMDGYSYSNGYVNLSFLIKDYEVIVGGEKIDTNFIVRGYTMGTDLTFSLSLNLGKVTFKKGDTIKINAIIMPWGSELLDDGVEDFKNGNYEYTSVIGTDENGDPIYYMNKNVLDVRENSILNPFTATAVSNAKVLDSVWVPKIKTTNGTSAEFTVKGGNNNCVVRVYGFSKLTSPVIEEFVNGKWMTYRVASASKKDGKGYGYFHDGYMVHYDEDGTYSYSFVIPMDKGAERKFRITAEADFKAWPELQYDPNSNNITTKDDPLNVYVDAKELASMKEDSMAYFTDIQLITDQENFAFTRYFPIAGSAEAITTPFDSLHDAYSALESTGQYLVFKYRIPEDAVSKMNNMQIFASTKNERPIDNNETYVYSDLKHDGEWHVVIINLAQLIRQSSVHFQPDDKGNYMAKYVRIDIFNNPVDEGMYIDLAYVGLCDNLEEIFELNKDMNEVTVVTTNGATRVDPETGGVPNNTNLNLFYAADTLVSLTKPLSLKSSELISDDDGEYARITAVANNKYEAYATIFSTTNPQYSHITTTGPYIVFKYRMPNKDAVKMGGLQIYTNTFEPSASYDSAKANFVYNMLNYDGEWHVVVLDLTQLLSKYVQPGEDGSYLLQHIRFDFLPVNLPGEFQMDYAYIGVADSLEKIYEFTADEKEVLLVTASDTETKMDPSTGKPVKYNQTNLNVYVGPDRFLDMATKQAGHMTVVSGEDGFVRLTGFRTKGDGTKHPEAYAKMFDATNEEFEDLTSTGQYIVFKYRLSSEVASTGLSLQFYTSTTGTGAGSTTGITLSNFGQYDDKWHVVIVDASKFIPNEYKLNDDNVYKAGYLRFDFIDGGSALPENFYIDYEYLAISDDLSKIYEFNKDMDEVVLIEGAGSTTLIDPKTGNEISGN